jgi:archaellum component FlaG (FlaF/FlaG flagellin family)
MKTFFSMILAGMVSTAVAQVDTAENVVHSTVRGTKQAARTVAHGVKKAADTVEDAFTPDSDARRVDVTITENGIDMPTQLRPGKTAFVVKNAGKTAQNFEVEGRSVDRKFVAAPNPGQTKVLHVYLKRGTYSVYSPGKTGDKGTPNATLRVR